MKKKNSVPGNKMKQSVSVGKTIQFNYKKKKKIYLNRLIMIMM